MGHSLIFTSIFDVLSIIMPRWFKIKSHSISNFSLQYVSLKFNTNLFLFSYGVLSTIETTLALLPLLTLRLPPLPTERLTIPTSPLLPPLPADQSNPPDESTSPRVPRTSWTRSPIRRAALRLARELPVLRTCQNL